MTTRYDRATLAELDYYRRMLYLRGYITERENARMVALLKVRTSDLRGPTISHGVGPDTVGVQHVIGEPCGECDHKNAGKLTYKHAPMREGAKCRDPMCGVCR